MTKPNITNKDLMKRLDDLEIRNKAMSSVFLFYSIAIAFIIGFFSTEQIMFLIAGIVSYFLGILFSYKMNERKT